MRFGRFFTISVVTSRRTTIGWSGGSGFLEGAGTAAGAGAAAFSFLG